MSNEIKDIEFDYLSIDIMKECMANQYKTFLGQFCEIDNIIRDYIFLCFLLGNDFIPNIPSLIIKFDGLDTLLNIYFNSFSNMKKYLVTNDVINNDFLLEIFKQLNNIEEASFNKINTKRSKYRFNNTYIYDKSKTDIENKFQEKLNEYLIVYNKQKDTIELGKPGGKKDTIKNILTYLAIIKESLILELKTFAETISKV